MFPDPENKEKLAELEKLLKIKKKKSSKKESDDKKETKDKKKTKTKKEASKEIKETSADKKSATKKKKNEELLIMKFIFLALLLAGVFVSCATDIPEEKPPVSAIYKVTDMHLLKDGIHILLLSSNFNRRYDYAQLSIYNIKEKKSVSALLLSSMSGKMAVSKDESIVYAASREKGGIQKARITYDKNNNPSLEYGVSTLDNSTIKTSSEPYALLFDENDEYLFVSHMRNGEIVVVYPKPVLEIPSSTLKKCIPAGASCYDKDENPLCIKCDSTQTSDCLTLRNGEKFISKTCETRSDCENGFVCADISKDTVVERFKLNDGITDIKYIKGLDSFLVSHKSNKWISSMKIREKSPEKITADFSRVLLNIPSPGTDIRGIAPSLIDENSFYISYRNYQEYIEDVPMIAKITITDTKSYSVDWVSRMAGRGGEISVVPYTENSISEMVFATSSEDGNIFVYDSATSNKIYEIDLEESEIYKDSCYAYQLHYSENGDKKRIFAGCFDENLILVVNADYESDSFFDVEEVIRD